MPDIQPPASTIANCKWCDSLFDISEERVPGECPIRGHSLGSIHVPAKSAPAEDRNAFGAQVSRLRDVAVVCGFSPDDGYSLFGWKAGNRLRIDEEEASWLASQLEELQERRERENAGTFNDEATRLLRQVITDLPAKRNWLDPDCERAARALLRYNGFPARFQYADAFEEYDDVGHLRDVLRRLADKTDGANMSGKCMLCGAGRQPQTAWIFEESTETCIPPADCSNEKCISHELREVLRG